MEMKEKRIDKKDLSKVLSGNMIDSIKNIVGETYSKKLKGYEVDIESAFKESVKEVEKWFEYNYGD